MRTLLLILIGMRLLMVDSIGFSDIPAGGDTIQFIIDNQTDIPLQGMPVLFMTHCTPSLDQIIKPRTKQVLTCAGMGTGACFILYSGEWNPMTQRCFLTFYIDPQQPAVYLLYRYPPGCEHSVWVAKVSSNYTVIVTPAGGALPKVNPAPQNPTSLSPVSQWCLIFYHPNVTQGKTLLYSYPLGCEQMPSTNKQKLPKQ